MTHEKPSPRHSPVAAGIAKIAMAALCLGWLAGCMPNTPEAAADTSTRYPLAAESRLVTQPVIFEDGEARLNGAEKARLDAFLAHFFKSGGGILEIRQTADANDPRAESRIQAVRRHVRRRGAQPYEIRLRRITSSDAGDGPIIVSFESFAVKSLKCNQRNYPITPNSQNIQHPDMGCSVRSGMAAMIANPADLQRPRMETPGYGPRRSRVIQNYGAGQPTEATRGDNEGASSIRDLGG